MTWTTALWKAAIWVLPNALPVFGLFVLFYVVEADPFPLEGFVKVLMGVSWCCLIVVPALTGLVHRSGKVALVVAVYEVAAIAALGGMWFDFFGGWVPRGFHP